jgi:hypothetical protein
MNLPNYFLADLPAEATLSPSLITEACQTLKRNRDRYLASRPTSSLASLLCGVARDWLDPDYRFRKLALEQGPAATGFSRQTLEAGLNAVFGQMTHDGFDALLKQELGHTQRFDELCGTSVEQGSGRAAMVCGPELLVHIAAGNLPPPALTSIIFGVLTKSAQFIKCASGASLIPRLFAHSLYEADPKLGSCMELAAWRGGSNAIEQALFAEADCVTATGSDTTLAALRRHVPERLRFVGYGHRVSFGFVSAEVLTGLNSTRVASRAARDVAAWDQLGCLSPHVIYVQRGGGTAPEQFAEMLAGELERMEMQQPKGVVPVDVAAGIASRRSIYEMRAAASGETRLWASRDSTAWTVVYETDPRFQQSCLHRFIYVKAVGSLEDALQNADPIRSQVSTVGIAVPEHKAQEVAFELARWGVSRVCPLGQMQNPPLTWRHDGRPALGDLLRWTDWEVGNR